MTAGAHRTTPRRTIRGKLMVILMVTSCGALLLACAAFAKFSHRRFREEVEFNLGVLANVVAEHTRVSFEQGDRRLAENMLSGLAANPHVRAAALYGPDGNRYAVYVRDAGDERWLPVQRELTQSSVFSNEVIEVSHRVYSGSRLIGGVFIVSDQDLIQGHLLSFAGRLPLVLVVGVGFAFLLSRQLQKLISRPIYRLSQFARDVGRRHDYSLRVEPSGESVETDDLARSFNEMLATIQRHERQLTESRDMAENASRAKAEFLANVSHELRTPMNGVVGLTDLLMRGTLADEQREYARMIQTSGHSLLSLIDEVLDLSKVESGKMELEDIAFDVRETFEHVLTMLARGAYDKGVDLALRVEHDVPRVLGGDPVRLQQVITNLVSNAVKFTEQGEVFVHVECDATATADHDTLQLKVAVYDTGIGLADDARERIFESFIQADGSTTRRFGGTGLGLALCKQLVEHMGGEIRVDSEEGRGSTFRFTCTLGLRTGGGLAALPAELAPLRERRAALVSESAREREILAHHLERVGVQCDRFEPVEWRNQFGRTGREHPYDFAVVSELGLIEGWPVATESVEDPLPVIVVSPLGEAPPVDGRTGVVLCAHMHRPIAHERMVQCLRELIQLEESATTLPVSTTDAEEEVPAEGDGYRILVAEDHPVNQKVIGEMLKRLGHHFDLVESGTAVVDAVREGRGYDLILMDCQMPEMDGYEAARRIRAAEEPGSRIPIVALTANVVIEDREHALTAGMDEYLVKPILLDELRSCLERWIERSLPLE